METIANVPVRDEGVSALVSWTNALILQCLGSAMRLPGKGSEPVYTFIRNKSIYLMCTCAGCAKCTNRMYEHPYEALK